MGVANGSPAAIRPGIARGFASVTDTTLTAVIAAPGPQLALMITALVIDNAHATTKTGVNLFSGTTKIWGPIPAPAAGGAVLIPLEPPLPCNANEPFQIQTINSVITVSVSALGYTAASGQT